MRSLRWLRPYRWPLLVSILLHVGFLLLLIGTQPAAGSNRRTIVPLLSLNSIPELGKSQPNVTQPRNNLRKNQRLRNPSKALSRKLKKLKKTHSQHPHHHKIKAWQSLTNKWKRSWTNLRILNPRQQLSDYPKKKLR